MRKIVGVFAVLSWSLTVGCRALDPSTAADPAGAPTEAAIDAANAFTQTPVGYVDCGVSVLTSGWPTTTMYVAEVATCILEAVEPAHYAYWGRDQLGGAEGAVIRLEASGKFLQIDFRVDDQGDIDSEQSTCSSLTSDPFEPPRCAP